VRTVGLVRIGELCEFEEKFVSLRLGKRGERFIKERLDDDHRRRRIFDSLSITAAKSWGSLLSTLHLSKRASSRRMTSASVGSEVAMGGSQDC